VNPTEAPAFLDTSYVVRYLVNKPPEMAAQASQVIDSGEPLILSEMAILESAYVLASGYQVSRQAIVDGLIELVRRENLHLTVLPKFRVLEALELCRESKRISFTDALLWAQTLESGVGRVYTFDRRFPSKGIALLGTWTPV
jgi:predicted nucleic-acid-binding protein